MYHLLTGQTPFVAESFMTMLTKHLMEEPVAPSARRPDLAITVEMDGLVLKALEKDRDKRWQSMAELLEAVGVCPGPETIAPKAPGGQTVEMGGANAAAALRILRTKGTASETERMPRKSVDSALSGSEIPARPRRASSSKTATLVVAGIVLGVAIAAWFALSRSKSQPVEPMVTTPPVAIVPAPAPPPTLPPAPVPAAAVPEPAVAVPVAEPQTMPEPASKHGPRGRKAKASSSAAAATKPAGEAPAAAAPKPASPPSMPGELKPFPKL
jgi:serine/threonine-protein kinase